MTEKPEFVRTNVPIAYAVNKMATGGFRRPGSPRGGRTLAGDPTVRHHLVVLPAVIVHIRPQPVALVVLKDEQGTLASADTHSPAISARMTMASGVS